MGNGGCHDIEDIVLTDLVTNKIMNFTKYQVSDSLLLLS